MEGAGAWRAKASSIIRNAMSHRRIDYAQMSDRLAKIGVFEDECSLRDKIHSGAFSAVFFLQCLDALHIKRLIIEAFEK